MRNPHGNDHTGRKEDNNANDANHPSTFPLPNQPCEKGNHQGFYYYPQYFLAGYPSPPNIRPHSITYNFFRVDDRYDPILYHGLTASYFVGKV